MQLCRVVVTVSVVATRPSVNRVSTRAARCPGLCISARPFPLRHRGQDVVRGPWRLGCVTSNDCTSDEQRATTIWLMSRDTLRDNTLHIGNAQGRRCCRTNSLIPVKGVCSARFCTMTTMTVGLGMLGSGHSASSGKWMLRTPPSVRHSLAPRWLGMRRLRQVATL